MVNTKQFVIVGATDVANDGSPAGRTFRLIPITAESPYQICHYSLESNSLLLVSKEKRTEARLIPAITETGEYKKNKSGQQLVERRSTEDWMEFSITDPESIKEFIEHTCVNADRTNLYMPLIAKIEPIKAQTMESPKLILQS